MTVKLEVSVETNRVGSQVKSIIEIDLDDSSTQKEIDKAVEKIAREQMFDMIEWNYKIV